MVALYNVNGVKVPINQGAEGAAAPGAGTGSGGPSFKDFLTSPATDLKQSGQALEQVHADLAASKISEQELMQSLTEVQLAVERITAISKVSLDALKKTVETPM